MTSFRNVKTPAQLDELARNVQKSRCVLREKVIAAKTGRTLTKEFIERLTRPITSSRDIDRRISLLSPIGLAAFAKLIQVDNVKVDKIKDLIKLEALIKKSKKFEKIAIPLKGQILDDIAKLIKNVQGPERNKIIDEMLVEVLELEEAGIPISEEQLSEVSEILSDEEEQGMTINEMFEEFDETIKMILSKDKSLKDELAALRFTFEKQVDDDPFRVMNLMRDLKKRADTFIAREDLLVFDIPGPMPDVSLEDLQRLAESRQRKLQTPGVPPRNLPSDLTVEDFTGEEVPLERKGKPPVIPPVIPPRKKALPTDIRTTAAVRVINMLLDPVTIFSIATPRSGFEVDENVWNFVYGEEPFIMIVDLNSGAFVFGQKDEAFEVFSFKERPGLWKLFALPWEQQGPDSLDFLAREPLENFSFADKNDFKKMALRVGINSFDEGKKITQIFNKIEVVEGVGIQTFSTPSNPRILPDQDLNNPIPPLKPIMTINVDPITRDFTKRGSGVALRGSPGAQGQVRFKPYTIQINQQDPTIGHFGQVDINLPQLMGFRKLIVFNMAGNQLFKEGVDETFIQLVTKRFNSRINYTPKAITQFRKLVKVAQLPFNPRSKKAQFINPKIGRGKILQKRIKFLEGIEQSKRGGQVLVINDVDEALTKLEMILAQLTIGNNGDENVNLAICINDFLLKKGTFTQDQHKQVDKQISELI